MHTLYLIHCQPESKYYVGQTCLSLERRLKTHRYDARRGSNLRLHRAMRKHGESKFTVYALMVVATQAEANKQEQFLIRLFRATDPTVGYNLASGGRGRMGGRPKLTEEEKIDRAIRRREIAKARALKHWKHRESVENRLRRKAWSRLAAKGLVLPDGKIDWLKFRASRGGII